MLLLATGFLAMPLPAVASGFSDGSSFNTPKGTANADFNAPASGYGRDANGNRTIVDGRFVGACYFNKDGLTPGVGSRSGVAEASGFPSDTCDEIQRGDRNNNTVIGNNVTVVTQGSHNTVIVNTQQTNNGNQKVVLNGKLSLN
ncbi:MAG: holdfast anchoring protein HfaA [Alphaproteobacteria bacterium]|jgi:holdfast attachment protein HfaA